MTKTICHWFLQSNGPVYNQGFASKRFLFKPTENIAGKYCIFKLNNVSMPTQLATPISVYLKGLTFSQNTCIDPSFSNYGEISPITFYQLVGDENRSSIIGCIGSFPTTSLNHEMPYLLVYVPPGPTYVELGMFSNNEVETDTWNYLELPPGPMNANTVYLNVLRNYGMGTYTASVSGPNGTGSPYLFFDKNNTSASGGWIGDGYEAITGNYIGNVFTSVGTGNFKNDVYGAYIQLYISEPYPVFRFSLNKRTDGREPRRVVIVGSMDGLNWTHIYTSTDDIIFPAGVNTQAQVDFQENFYATSYLYWRMIVTHIGPIGSALTECDLTEMRLRTYIQTQIPSAALTANTDTIVGETYMNGTYTASVSGPGGTSEPYKIFDRNTALTNNIGTGYDITTGDYLGTEFTIDEFTGQTYYGAYVTIELPRRISMQSYRIYRQYDSSRPRRFAFFGSNDNIKWYMVYDNTFFDASWSGNLTNRQIVPLNGQYYKFYRLLANVIGLPAYGSSGALGIAEIYLYGNNEAWDGNAHFITEFEPIDDMTEESDNEED